MMRDGQLTTWRGLEFQWCWFGVCGEFCEIGSGVEKRSNSGTLGQPAEASDVSQSFPSLPFQLFTISNRFSTTIVTGHDFLVFGHLFLDEKSFLQEPVPSTPSLRTPPPSKSSCWIVQLEL
jgi:hypothetical protein